MYSCLRPVEYLYQIQVTKIHSIIHLYMLKKEYQDIYNPTPPSRLIIDSNIQLTFGGPYTYTVSECRCVVGHMAHVL